MCNCLQISFSVWSWSVTGTGRILTSANDKATQGSHNSSPMEVPFHLTNSPFPFPISTIHSYRGSEVLQLQNAASPLTADAVTQSSLLHMLFAISLISLSLCSEELMIWGENKTLLFPSNTRESTGSPTNSETTTGDLFSTFSTFAPSWRIVQFKGWWAPERPVEHYPMRGAAALHAAGSLTTNFKWPWKLWHGQLL